MRLKHVFCFVAVIVLFISFLVSCKNNNGTDDNDTRPIIRLAAPHNPYIEDFETNKYKLWLEEQTGLRIEMDWLPAKDAEQIARLALTTGENLPDAYVGFGSYELFNSSSLQRFAEQGRIIALDEYIEKYGDNIKKAFVELKDDNVRELVTAADGHIYYMLGFSSSIITRYRQVMWINKGWLDKLNLQVPTTTEEFREVLQAFATRDPNNNGINDEIPLCGTEEAYSKQPYDYLFGAFIYNDEKHSRLLKENGNLSFAPIRDEWRNALMYMRSLYDEGLISPLTFTQDDKQLQQMANDPRDILGAFTTAGITRTVLQNSPEIMQRYVGIGPLTGPDGVRLSSVSIPLPKPNGVITSASQYPEEVFKLFDLMLSEEACLMGRYGEKGVDWEFAKPGDLSIYGTPATVRIINQLWNTPQNKHLMQICPYISRPKYSGGVTWDGNTTDGEYMNAQAALQYVGSEPEEYVGALVFTPAEENEIAEIRDDIEAHVRRTIVEFITGERDVYDDEVWELYKLEYAELGLNEFLEAAQRASDRMGE